MGEIGIGAALRRARAEQGRSVADVATSTRMRVQQVEALEEDRFGVFGGDVYAKGFLKTYALDVGLDPAPLLETYRRYVQHDVMDHNALSAGPVTTTSPRPAPPAWIGWAAGLVLLLGAGFVLAQFVGTRAPTPAVDVAASPPPAPATPTPTTSDGGGTASAAPTAAPSPSPTPTFDGVNVVLAFDESAWVRVTTDGQVVQEGLQEQGTAIEYEGEEEVLVRIGNAGGVRARLNGEGVGSLGGSGAVVDVLFTPDSFEVL